MLSEFRAKGRWPWPLSPLAERCIPRVHPLIPGVSPFTETRRDENSYRYMTALCTSSVLPGKSRLILRNVCIRSTRAYQPTGHASRLRFRFQGRDVVRRGRRCGCSVTSPGMQRTADGECLARCLPSERLRLEVASWGDDGHEVVRFLRQMASSGSSPRSQGMIPQLTPHACSERVCDCQEQRRRASGTATPARGG